jgi:hypothetical protein
MKILVSTAIAAALALTLPACKQPPAADNEAAATETASLDALNGTWTVDLASAKFDQKPNEILLKDGTYDCKTCIPPLTTPADGAFHAIADRPYFDSIQIKTVDDKTVEVHRKKGDKEVSWTTFSVSEDGNTLTGKFHDATTPNSPPVTGEFSSNRVAPGPAGSHAISGQWMPNKFGDYAKEALDVTFTIAGSSVTRTSQGQTYTAELGGPEVAVQNDPGGTMVKVERAGNGIKETYSRAGKVVDESTVTLNADGTVGIVSHDPRDASTTTFTAKKKG